MQNLVIRCADAGTSNAATDCNLRAGDALSLEWNYAAGSNNGNVAGTTEVLRATSISGQSTLTATIGYDALNRLSSFAEAGPAPWSVAYQYDAYGNRAIDVARTTVALGTLGATDLGQFARSIARTSATASSSHSML